VPRWERERYRDATGDPAAEAEMFGRFAGFLDTIPPPDPAPWSTVRPADDRDGADHGPADGGHAPGPGEDGGP
jgi:hypothetical protein